jgi:glutamyl-tRNA synthetase
VRTRIAPTPSGYLHLGNAYNFYLIQKYANEKKGTILLRIDDFDFDRARDEYIEDIFKALQWLHISPDEGPLNLADFHKSYSQKNKQQSYRKVLKLLEDKALIYACECSRSQTDRFTEFGAYRGHCREKNLNYVEGKHSLRLRCEDLPDHSWKKTLFDFVLWTKENRASYQLVSVVEDVENKIDFVVRGEDLKDSSGAQLYLAQQLGGVYKELFEKIEFIHHPLIVDPQNPAQKLSKNLNSRSLTSLIKAGYTYDRFLAEFTC